jgi:hypothetical protein
VLIAGGAGAGLVAIGLVVFLLTRGSGKAPQAGAEGAAASVAGTAPAADAVAGWKVMADPPAAPVHWPEKLAVSAPIPEKSIGGQGNEVCYPSTPSPFVALGMGTYESDGVQMWNLLTGTRVGAIRGKPSNSSKRLVSPDGKYLALEVTNVKLPKTVEFWSFETGELVKSVVCDDANYVLAVADFSAPDQFFTYTFGPGFGGKYVHRIKIWDIPGGKLIRQIDVGDSDVNQHKARRPMKMRETACSID